MPLASFFGSSKTATSEELRPGQGFETASKHGLLLEDGSIAEQAIGRGVDVGTLEGGGQ